MGVALIEGLAQDLEDHELATWQASGVYGSDVEWPVYVDVAGQESRNAITLSEYGPDEPDSARPYDDVRLQVRVRGDADPRTARDKLRAIFDRLHGLGPTILPGGEYLQLCRALQTSPISLGQNSSGRWEFSQNYKCSIENLTAHRSA